MILSYSSFAFICVAIMMYDWAFNVTSNQPEDIRGRVLKFALTQDFLILLTTAKLVLFDGHSFRSVVDSYFNSGFLNRVYIATNLVLHGTLLFDEPVDHGLRLTPAHYLPPTITQDQRDLFLL